MKTCSAVVWEPSKPGHMDTPLCKNGFPIGGACLGTAGTPICLQEEVCGRIYDYNGGRPLTLEELKAR